MKNNFIKVLVMCAILFSMSCGHGNGGKDNPNNPPKPPTPAKKLNVKTLTVHKGNAITGTVVIDENKTKVEKGDIELEFKEWKPGKAFSITPETITLANKGDKATFKISTNATSEFAAWDQEITVIRSSGMNADKTMEECLATLASMLTWNNSITDKDITLPETIQGFDGLTITWESSNEKACTKQGVITRDLEDVEVTLTPTVKYKGETRTTSFKVTVARIMLLTKKKVVNGKDVISKLDFSEKGSLLVDKNNEEEMEKYEIKNIDTKAKTIRLALKEIKDHSNGGKLTKIDDIFSNLHKHEAKVVEATFGKTYKKLFKASTILWEDIKTYVIGVSKANSQDGTTAINTDEEDFDYIKNVYGAIATSYQDFQALNENDKTTRIKAFLTTMKNNVCDRNAFQEDIKEEDIFGILLEDRKLSMENHSMRLSKEKDFSYVLEKTTDATYPEGHKLLMTAIHQKDKAWHEQNGNYHTANSRLELVAEHFRKNSGLVARFIYENQDQNVETYRGIISNEEFLSKNYAKEVLVKATIKDEKTDKIDFDIIEEKITPGSILRGGHELKFYPELIGFQE